MSRMPSPDEIDAMDFGQMIGFMATMLERNKRPDLHFHRCKNKACRTTFSHKLSEIPDDEDAYHKAHACPGCGSDCRTWYSDEKEAADRG